jgi:hypothetical protein
MSEMDMMGTETTPHVRDLMDAAHADRAARETHGREAVNAGPPSGDDGYVDAPGIDEPAPMGMHGAADPLADYGESVRPGYQTLGQD